MGILSSLKSLFSSKNKNNAELKEDIKKILYEADLGSSVVEKLLSKIKGSENFEQARTEIENNLISFLKNYEGVLDLDQKPFVIMVVGVNGVGKTTASAKLAYLIKNSLNKKVLLVGADTFRAAAVEQLEHWAKKIGCDFFSKGTGADAGAVGYESVTKAAKENIDVVIIDTGGRLHTQKGLMSEAAKIQKAIAKSLPGAPHHILLVVDATQGQNIQAQSDVFGDFMDISGVVLTKFDGTAKGGALIKALEKLNKPVFYVGVGEGAQDIRAFRAQALSDKIFRE